MLSTRALVRSSLVAILFVPTSALAQIVLHPGEHHVFGSADAGSTRIGRIGPLAEYIGDGLLGLADGDADFDLATRRVRAEIRHFLALGGNFESRSTIWQDFTVADSANLQHRVGAWLAYGANWKGVVWNGVGLISNASVELVLVLTDRTESRELQRVVLHDRDAATFKVKFVKVGNPLQAQESGSSAATLPAILTRGHTYRITMALICQIFTPETVNPLIITSDYMAGLFDQGDGGATFSRLEIKLGADDAEISDRLAQFAIHRHEYRKHKGDDDDEEAKTGPPIICLEEDDDVLGTGTSAEAARQARAGMSLQLANPFQVNGRVDFTLPAAGDVSVRLFDVNGRLVREIARERFEAGTHSVRWDGGDPNTAHSPPGVYFLRLQAGAAMVSKKLTLLP